MLLFVARSKSAIICGRYAVDGGDLGLLEFARSDELGIFGRNGDTFVGHTALQQQRDVGVVQTDRLGDEVFLEPLVGFGLERRGIFEDARHIAALIEEAFAVELRRDGECEVVAMDGDRTFALVAIGREPRRWMTSSFGSSSPVSDR